MYHKTTSILKCVSCKSVSLKLIGQLPSSDKFAGRFLASPIEGGMLYECEICGIQFRHPRLSKDELDDAYRQGDEANWVGHSQDRNDWKIVANLILTSKQAGKILDIGCFDGGFLRTLRGHFLKYGVEVNAKAANNASAHGINIICDDFDDLTSIGGSFDIVVAIDVIEHVDDPLKFLTNISSKLAPDGIILLSTGNTHAWSWRIMGSLYWYCANPEHISFINPSWCYGVATSLGLKLEYVQMFSYRNGSCLRQIYDFIKNVLFKIFPSFFVWLRIMGIGKRKITHNKDLAFYPPTWLTAQDHFVALFKKI